MVATTQAVKMSRLLKFFVLVHRVNLASDHGSSLRKHTYAIFGDFYGCKNVNFQMKNCYIFLIFAQNIDRGYT